MFHVRPSRRQMYADDPRFLWKYILRSLATVLAVTSIGLVGWSLADQVAIIDPFVDSYSYADYAWPNNPDIWFLPWDFIALGLSVLWNLANVLVLVARNRPIHPGANVACDLILWLALLVTGTFATLGAQAYLWWSRTDYANISYDSGSAYFILPNGTVRDTAPTPCPGCAAFNNALTRKGTVVAVAASLTFLILLAHFALFVSACRFTNARRVTAMATVIADRLHAEKKTTGDAADESRNPNAAFVPISEPVEQQAPLNYGMPPAPTGMTVGDRGRERALMAGEQRRGARCSCEQPEVVVGGGGARAVTVYGDDVYEP